MFVPFTGWGITITSPVRQNLEDGISTFILSGRHPMKQAEKQARFHFYSYIHAINSFLDIVFCIQSVFSHNQLQHKFLIYV